MLNIWRPRVTHFSTKPRCSPHSACSKWCPELSRIEIQPQTDGKQNHFLMIFMEAKQCYISLEKVSTCKSKTTTNILPFLKKASPILKIDLPSCTILWYHCSFYCRNKMIYWFFLFWKCGSCFEICCLPSGLNGLMIWLSIRLLVGDSTVLPPTKIPTQVKCIQ